MFSQEVPSNGMLFPRLTTAQRTAMPANIAEGIHVFDTNTNTDWVYNGSSWNEVNSNNLGNHVATTDLAMANNKIDNISSINLNAIVTPATPTAGEIYFNSADSHFYGWNGSAWKQLD